MLYKKYKVLSTTEYSIYISLIVTAVPLFYYIFVHQYSFNYLAEINGHYFNLLLSLAFVLLILATNRNELILISLKITLIIITLIYYKIILNNEVFAIIFSFFLLSIVQIHSIIENHKYIFGLTIIITISELVYTFCTADFVNFKFSGSFGNSGVLSLYLVVSFPLLYYFIKTFISQNIFRHIFCSLFIGIISLICVLNLSRISILILLFILGAIFYQSYLRYKLKKSHRIPLLFSLILSSIILINYLFYIKQNSALDRFLRTEIILNNLVNSSNLTSILLGNGIGKLSRNYPSWQIEYFTSNSDPNNSYFLIAGDSFLAFNEYFELFYDIGIIGFMIFFILNFWVLTYKNKSYYDILFYLKLVIISILLAATTTYAFHINAVLYIYVLCCTFILSLRFRKFLFATLKINRTINYIFILLTIFSVLLIGNECFKIKIWKKELSNISLTEKNYTEKLDLLYEDLEYNSKFLLHYGSILVQSDSLNQIAYGVRLLEENKEVLYSEHTLISLINGHTLLKNEFKSLKYAQDLVHLIPSKFNHRFRLIKLYELYNLRKECLKEINFTLNMPIKVPSEEVTLIKKKLKEMKINLEKEI